MPGPPPARGDSITLGIPSGSSPEVSLTKMQLSKISEVKTEMYYYLCGSLHLLFLYVDTCAAYVKVDLSGKGRVQR